MKLLDWVFDQFLYPLYASLIETFRRHDPLEPDGDGVSDSFTRLRDAAAPARYYGDGGTIHRGGDIDVAVDKDGNVREVMFRCQWLPFNQVSFEDLRHDGVAVPMPRTRIKGIVTEDVE